jgi:glycosyltransferase involved in cell wall biosynthesis
MLKNILHVSYSKSGGAGNVAAQLSTAQSLRDDYKSNFLYATETNLKSNPFNNLGLTVRAAFDNFVIKNQTWPSLFSIYRNVQDPYFYNNLIKHKGILHLHWLNGILNLDSIVNHAKMGKKIIWTIHDMEPFTGGCHNSNDCKNFEESCSECPAVKQIFRAKIQQTKKSKNLYISLMNNVKLVFPSQWLMNNFKSGAPQYSSALEIIPNPVSDIYFEKDFGATNSLNTFKEHLVLGFVSSDLNDPVKQFDKVLYAIQEVSLLIKKPIKLFAVGAKFRNFPKGLNYEIVESGVVSNENDLRDIYSKLDLLISNSISESFGLTIAEASAVGVPSLVLAGSGSSELIKDNSTGFIYKNQVDLISKLIKISESETLILEIGAKARENALIQWKLENVLNKYDKLYENLL